MAGGGRAVPAPEEARDRLATLLARRSFRTGRFTLSSGRTSPYYVDSRTTTMHAEGQVLLGIVGHGRIRREGLRPDFVGGMTMGADPMAYAIAAQSWRSGDRPIHAFSVRKRAKEHGRGRRIEGCFEAGSRVVVVEDVITTGGSALKACRAVEHQEGRVLAVLALVDRGEGGREALEEAGYEVHGLFHISDLKARAAG